MSDLFNSDWMTKFKAEWNNEPELTEPLEKIGFSSVIGYGYQDEDKPLGFIKVENGQVTEAGPYNDEQLNWDLRATNDQWNTFFKKELGMTGLGIAFTTGKIKFKTGDYSAMIKDPRMATPFVKSFSVMGRIQ